MPIKVGITGGIGSGKTIVAKIFHSLGSPVYDADSRAKGLLNEDQVLMALVKQEFGEESYTDQGLDRRYMASNVFNDSAKLKKLNALVHPRVGDDFKEWVIRKGDQPYLIKEAALLIESGSYKELDVLIVVDAPEQVRIDRIKKRDPQRSVAEIRAIIDKQMKQEEKKSYADVIISNDDTVSITEQVFNIHTRLLEGSF